MNAKELRELDAWIAKTIYGWVDTNYSTGYFPDTPENRILNPGFALSKERAGFLFLFIQKYTTDPAAALRVLEKCAEKLPVCVFKSAISGKWIADYESPEGHDFGIHGEEADTLPLAICLFAKKLFNTEKPCQ